MALYLTESDVRELLTMDLALEVLEEAFAARARGGFVNHPRSRISLVRGSYNLMSAAWLEKGVVGQKSYVATRAGIGFHVLLYSATGEGLLAIMEAGRLGQVRTGAASGLATKYMALPGASRAAVIGTGYQARTQLAAVAAVRPLASATVYSRNAERRLRFAERMSETLAIEVAASETARECVDGADIIVTVTNAREPVLLGEWIGPGAHVNAAGANSWLRRELDTAAVVKSEVIATDDIGQARIECADLMRAVEVGRLTWERVEDLANIVAGRVRGRCSEEGVTLFESQGVALEDIAVAERLYRMAKERGVGSRVPA